MSGLAEVLRKELAKGGYQMPGDTLPYETQAARIAAALTAAGLGLVADPGVIDKLAKALDGGEVIHVHHHDIESHATSYNEGYEDAVTQGLADDPTLAWDWLEGKLTEAKAQAWGEGMEAMYAATSSEWPPIPEANPYRAAAVRGEG